MSRLVVLWGVLGMLALSLTSTAGAQSVGRDVVRTRDGAMYRGTVIENVPGSHVVLLTPTGETRRFAESDVASLTTLPSETPAESVMPPAVVPLGVDGTEEAAVAGGNQRIRVQVVGEEPAQTLMLRTGGRPHAIQRLCTAPCALTLDVGNHSFAVQDSNGSIRATQRPTFIDRDGTLHIGIQSRRGGRIGRSLLGLGLVAIGAGVLVHGLNVFCDDGYAYSDHCDMSPGGIAVGTLIATVGHIVFFKGVFSFDRGRVQFTPTP